MDGLQMESKQEPASVPSPQAQPVERELRARVDAVWEQMHKGVSTKTLNSIINSRSLTETKTPQKDEVSHNWMTVLGLGPKKTEANGASEKSKSSTSQNGTSDEAKKLAAAALGAAKGNVEVLCNANGKSTTSHNGTSDEAKKLAAAALAAARDAAAASAALGRGKVEVKEIRDFAGQEIEVKKFVDASENVKAQAGASSAVDAVLDQIRKKPKLSVLDKTKTDWGEFKEENRGLEEELDAYKKSSNQYLDKVSFLQRADYREYERERDARLATQAKRRPDMCEDP